MCDNFSNYTNSSSCYLYSAVVNNVVLRNIGLLKAGVFDYSFSSSSYQKTGLIMQGETKPSPLGDINCIYIKQLLLDPAMAYRGCLYNVTEMREINLTGHRFSYGSHSDLLLFILKNFLFPKNVVIKIGYDGESEFSQEQRDEIIDIVKTDPSIKNATANIVFVDDSLANPNGGKRRKTPKYKKRKARGTKSKRKRKHTKSKK
jgi:hypothetical protein